MDLQYQLIKELFEIVWNCPLFDSIYGKQILSTNKRLIIQEASLKLH